MSRNDYSEDRYSQDKYYFHQGTSCYAYKYMGAHKVGDKMFFRVWAPNAEQAYLIGNFNSWSDNCPMTRLTEKGIWECSLPAKDLTAGDVYKYKFINHGREIYKTDPYAVKLESPPESASVIYDIEKDYEWHDSGWLDDRRKKYDEGFYSQPMNIYELHLGSWKRHEDGTYFGYKEIADDLAPYVKQMGYTHVEIMPVTEYPFDGSWGYQVGGYYAPTSRFGTPHEFMNFVDIMHSAGIGVIMDWVPAHFPKDAFGLYEFDGQPLYEYQAPDRMENKGWGTRRFDVGREEIQSFLVSNAFYWIEKYHIDGLRVDAVASMLYLDYEKNPGEWVPNVYGDNRCLESVAFFKKLNGAIKGVHPDVLTIAEESSAWPNVTGFDNDGLGFDLKWNMGWMNDTLFYAKKDPVYRKYHHHEKLTFSLMYAFNEKYVLPLSHDEVVHCKHSMVDKMPGDYWRKFAGDRVFLAWQMTHPGKKLNFMGNEFAQFREWNYAAGLEWNLLDYDMHKKFQLYVAEINHLYLSHPEFWQIDDSWDGFAWINANDTDRSILSYRRIAKNGSEAIVVLNFTPEVYEDYVIDVPRSGRYEEIFNSDDWKYGGSGVTNFSAVLESVEECGGAKLHFRVPPLGVSVLRLKTN